MSFLSKCAAGGLTVFFLAGCVYDGNIENPLMRKVAWYSLIEGEDLRGACAVTPNTFRLVYNGNYDEQVRLYEAGPDGLLTTRILGPAYVNQVDLYLSDPSALFAGITSHTPLSETLRRDLATGVARAIEAHPMAAEEIYHSAGYYWMASGCRDGVAFFHAWQSPDVKVLALPFVPVLQAVDTTGVSFAPPRPVSRLTSGAFPVNRDAQRGRDIHFRLRVGPDGIIRSRLFSAP